MKRHQQIQIAVCSAVLFLLVAGSRVLGDGPSTGVNGINSQGLGLTGAAIGIGQTEVERPGLPGFDNAANSHPNVIPAGVFLQDAPAIANVNTENHAEEVAGVMISTDAVDLSVASGGSLFSGADSAVGPNIDQQSAITAPGRPHVGARRKRK